MSKMKADFDSILRGYGHDVYIQKRIVDSKGAVSWSDTLIKYTTRHAVPSNRALPQSQVENMEGVTNTSDRIFYFSSEVNIWEGDRIYEDDPRAPDGRVIWKIDQVLSMNGNYGELVYLVAGVTRLIPN